MRAMHTTLVQGLALAGLLLTAALPARAADGVLLRWDQCAGDAGAVNKSFACDTNAGTDLLVASFVNSLPLTDPIGGLDARFRVTSASPALPAWWGAMSGGCRTAALTVIADPPPGSAQCISWASTNAPAAGVSTVLTSSNSIQISASSAIPTTVSLAGAQEYFALALGVRHVKTIGAGSCGGCNIPVCIAFENITLPQQVFPRVLTSGASGEASRFVSWQNSVPSDIRTDCTVLPGDRLVCTTTFSCAAAVVTQTRSSSWMQVKSLYR